MKRADWERQGMQTILGATGQIAIELGRNYTSDLRLVSRSPARVNATDVLTPANLLNAHQTMEAVKGNHIVRSWRGQVVGEAGK
jgi:hypothetical protein